MLKKTDVAVLDFGSSKISVLVGERGINDTFNIKGSGEAEYSGFANGEFYEPGKLKEVLKLALTQAEDSVKYKITELYVGVPGEFTTSVCRETSMSFRGRRKVTEIDIDELYKSGDIFAQNREYVVLNKTPIYFVLDDNNRTIRPVGSTASKLSGFLCYTLAERRFIISVTKLLMELGLKDVKCISSELAEVLFLFDKETRDGYALMVDVGYLTTNVVVARGEGMLYSKTLPLGGGHITGDLSECLHIGFSQAELLKRKVELSLEVTDEDRYELMTKEAKSEYPSIMVHEIVAARLEQLGELLQEAIAECPYSFPEYIPIRLTGGGIGYMRGAKEYLAKFLDKKIELAVPSVPQINKPHLSSVYGVLDFALKLEEPQKKQGFFSRLIFGE